MDNLSSVKTALTNVQHAVDAFDQDRSIQHYKAVQACARRLQVVAANPEDTLFTFRLQVTGNIAVSMLIELGVLDALVARFGGRADASELAVETMCNESLIVRLMRVLTALCFCEEVGERKYEANPLTVLLAQPGWVGALRWMEMVYPVAANTRQFLASKSFIRGTETCVQSPFEFVHGSPIWKVMEDSSDQRHNFDMWMRERKKHQETSWHRIYPPSASFDAASMKSSPDAVLMIDIGGATGSQLINFHSQFPHLPGRLILQDLPVAVASVEVPDGIEVQAYDFFTPQPMKGAKFYYLRNVLHNWPTEKCAEILHNIAAAMERDYSKLLIDDYVLPSQGAELRSVFADIHMLNVYNSSERTSSELSALIRAAGLKIAAIYPAGTNEECMIEVERT